MVYLPKYSPNYQPRDMDFSMYYYLCISCFEIIPSLFTYLSHLQAQQTLLFSSFDLKERKIPLADTVTYPTKHISNRHHWTSTWCTHSYLTQPLEQIYHIEKSMALINKNISYSVKLMDSPRIVSTVKQLLFAAILFRDSSVVNWIAASSFCDGAVLIKVLPVIFSLRQEIFATMRLPWTSLNFFARE
jgi:hypothetical protein